MLTLTLNSVKDVCTEKHIDISLEPESEQRSQVKLFMLTFAVPSVIHSQSILFKDDCSGYRFVYLMREKSEVCQKLKWMLAESKAAGHTVKNC